MKISKKNGIAEQVRKLAEDGVAYDPGNGAICPSCGNKLAVLGELPKQGKDNIRSHMCETPSCFFRRNKAIIKSIEKR